MKQKLYLVIRGKIGSTRLSCMLAEVLYMLACVIYWVQKWFIRKRHMEGDLQQARKHVISVSNKPLSEVRIVNQPVNQEIDLSIIVPVYNYEHVLDEMIQSILNQNTAYTYELILVDDGSGPRARSILEKYADKSHIQVIFQRNQGISAARNTGINAATGKYIMFVDCDDVLKPEIVQTLLDKAYEKDTDIVMCAHALVKQHDGREVGRREDIYPAWNLENYGLEDRHMNYPGLPWGKVYKRELFNEIRFPLNYWYEDTVTQFLLFRKARSFEYVPRALYDYRWYEGNYSKVQKKSNTRCIEHYWIVEYMLEESARIGLKQDDVQYRLVLKHLGSYLYYAIQHLDKDVLYDVFLLACDLACRMKPNHQCHLSFKLKELEKSFESRNFERWVLVCKWL